MMLNRWFSYIKVNTIQLWKTHVLDSSIPAIVQFHADWSEASNHLKQKLTSEHDNVFYNIVEVETDELMQIAQILSIKVAPTIFLINKGKTVKRFDGTIPEKEWKNFINELKVLSGCWTEEDYVIHLMNEAYELFISKKYDEAIELYKKALNVESTRLIFEASIITGLVKSHFQRGDYESTEFYINELQSKHKNDLAKHKEISKELEEMLQVIGNKRDNSKYLRYKTALEDANRDIHLDPFNDEKHVRLALIHYDFGFIEEAILKSLQIIESEGTLTGKGYKALMEIIADLGQDNIYVKKFQPRLDLLHKRLKT